MDDSITKRLQEEKDKFLPKDPATKEYVDEAIKQVAGGDILVSKEGVFIKANGHYRATAPLDIDNHKMENLPEPLEDGDAVNKKYVDGIVEDLTLKQGLIRENGGFNLVDSYINMNFNNIRNVGYHKHNEDAVPRSFVDDKIKTTLGQVQNQFKQLNQLVSISGSCYEDLKKNDYQFTFGGPFLEEKRTAGSWQTWYNGFLVPANGVIKHFTTMSTGLLHSIIGSKYIEAFNKRNLDALNRKNNPIQLFSLMKINIEGEKEIIGSMVYYLTNIINIEGIENWEKPVLKGTPVFEFRPVEKHLNKEENFICSVNQGDIINIRSDYTENITGKDALSDNFRDEDIVNYGVFFTTEYKGGNIPGFNFRGPFLHLTTLTFLFKEMSFPNILELNPLDEEDDN